jgi:hypothetical protein|tara:strand:+ start:144 stop:506 length:363 start_codon:yes stop_codon:yes gene_type:complete
MAKTKWCCIERCEKRGDARANYEQLGDVYCTLHALDIYESKVDTLVSKNAALIKQRNKTSTDLQNVISDLGINWMMERRNGKQAFHEALSSFNELWFTERSDGNPGIPKDRDAKVCWCGQ